MAVIPLRPDFLAIAGKAAGKVGDPKAAARARRYRRRKRDARGNSVTPATVTVSTLDMVALAAHLSVGTATIADLELAGRLVLALMARLPADGALALPG